MVPGARASQSNFRLNVKKKSHIRPKRIANKIGKFLNEIQRNAAAVPLVRHGSVVITIADDHFAARQGGPDLFLNVLTARRIEQQKLGCRREVYCFGVKQDLANAFADSRSARLSSNRMWDGMLFEVFG